MKEEIVAGTFVSRPNRFISYVSIGGEVERCHMPNPGRMWELLYEGTKIWLRKSQNPKRKTKWDVVGIERDGVPILLDTQYNNDIAVWLITHHLIPGWEEWNLIRREVTVGDSRFDLLLQKGDEPFYVEVKSCTLFGKEGAMFPDAVTDRGRKHIMELAQMHRQGIHTGVLFLVHWNRAQWFLPDYHTDSAFAAAFQEASQYLDWKAFSLSWDSTFTHPEPGHVLTYPEYILKRENHDCGDYLVIMEMEEEKTLSIGSKGLMTFPKGWYVYVGSAKKNLAARLARHQRKRKKMHWHIDYLRQHCNVTAVIPIRTADDLEHDLAQAVASIAGWAIPGFGCTDCNCNSHLYGFSENPVHVKSFMDVVEEFRINRLTPFLNTHR